MQIKNIWKPSTRFTLSSGVASIKFTFVNYHLPRDSKWPFYTLVGGHLTFERVTNHHPKKGHKEFAIFRRKKVVPWNGDVGAHGRQLHENGQHQLEDRWKHLNADESREPMDQWTRKHTRGNEHHKS